MGGGVFFLNVDSELTPLSVWFITGLNSEVLSFSPAPEAVLPGNAQPDHISLPNLTSVILPVPTCR